MLGRVVRWSLDRPRLIAWACVWFMVWGLLYIRDVRADLLPNVAPAQTVIQTEAPGLVAEQVEALVTRPIETALIGASGVAHVRSDSVQGLSMVTVGFAAGADPYRTRQAVSERLSAIAGTLPAGAEPPHLAPMTAPGAEVIKIGFTSDKLDPMALRDLVQWSVRPRLLAAAGVARVAVYGGQTRRIEVRARPGDLSDSDLGFLDILNATRRATSVAGAGFIDTPNQRVLIQPQGQALTADDVAAGQIQTAGAAPVRIADVADVVEAPAPAFGDALIMGRPGVLVDVARQYEANTLQTTHAVEEALAAMRPALAAQGVDVRTDLDRPATFTTAAMRGIALDLVIGAVLIAIALVVFLRDRRAVLVSMISIPLSLLAAVIALKALGWTLNSLTLGGLAVGLGVAIDDAVIGVETVLARLRQAEHAHASPLEAVLHATLEVRGPVVYATLAVIVALAPLLALQGVQGALLGPVAGAAIAASLASLLVATVVTPALCLLFHRKAGSPAEPSMVNRLKDIHGAWLTRLCARRGPVLIVAAVAGVLALGAITLLRPELSPSINDGHLVVVTNAPAATALEVMRADGVRLSDAFKRLGGVRAVSQTVGRDATDDASWGLQHAIYDLDLTPGLGAGRQKQLARRITDQLALDPGLGATVRSRFDAGQGDLQAGAPVQISLYGPDLDALDTAAGQIERVLKGLPGANSVEAQPSARAPSVRVDLNFSRLALFGLSAADVLDTVQAAFAGERVAQIYQAGRVVDLAVSAQADLRRDPEAVGDLLLRSTTGVSVPLKSVANIYLSDGRAMIAHDGGLRRQVITASPRNPGQFESAARKAIAAHVTLPAGAFLEFGGTAQAASKAGRGLLINYALAAIAVIALLSIAFDGRTGALILTASLLSLTGAVIAIVLLGGVLSIGAIAGLVAVLGLSMRNGMLLFGRLEDLVLSHEAGWSPETVIQATRERLTPLLMAGLLVGLAVAPLALSAGEAGREILGPMAIVMIGGLVTGVLASLFVLPAMIMAYWRPGFARLARRDPGATANS